MASKKPVIDPDAGKVMGVGKQGRKYELYIDANHGDDAAIGDSWSQAHKTTAKAKEILATLEDYDELLVHAKSDEGLDFGEPNIPVRAQFTINGYPTH